jgi:hypothetical protein
MPIESPLHALHVAAGAKFADFAGWSMPLEYTGVVSEHNAVREAVGVFDVSHLGTLMVRGPVDVLNTVLTNDLGRLADGQAQYTLCLNESGGVVDDLIAYRISDREFLLIPNAANCAEVAERLGRSGLSVSDVTREIAIIAVQGPASDELIAGLGLPELEYMSFGTARSRVHDARSVEPATPGSAASRSSPPSTTQQRCGRRWWPPVRCRAGSAPATPFARKWGIRCTAMNCSPMFRPGGRRSVGRCRPTRGSSWGARLHIDRTVGEGGRPACHRTGHPPTRDGRRRRGPGGRGDHQWHVLADVEGGDRSGPCLAGCVRG